MESGGAVRTERRGRKRKNKDVDNDAAADGALTAKKKRETRSKALVGRYVKKDFDCSGVFIGKIVYYDTGLYRIDYEDGDSEDLESGELKEFLIENDELDREFLLRKKKLDDLVSKKYAKEKDAALVKEKEASYNGNFSESVEQSVVSESRNDVANEIDGVQGDGDADSSSDSCEYTLEQDATSEVEASPLLAPPPRLPPSSGNIAVPGECISHLFSVYGFLRSFSARLFLRPFGLDDFVGSLNCSVPNTLLDAIHVALMRALRRHFEALSSDGSELASRCLRCVDWSLLDTLTWPVYLVHYLLILGYTEGPEWKGFYVDALERDYYTLSAARKLMILQILCDDVLDSAELRAEIDMREESEVGVDPEGVTVTARESVPRRVHPRYSKTSACKEKEAMEIIVEGNTKLYAYTNSVPRTAADAGIDQDGNGDECRLCGMDGTLICCDGCPSAYHSRCIGVSKMHIPEGPWYCPECSANQSGPTITKGGSLRGAEIFGIDPYEQVFLGTCGHLLVLKVSLKSEPCIRYYNRNDISSLLRALYSTKQNIDMYWGICEGILQHWDLQEDALYLKKIVGSLNYQEMAEFENFASSFTESSSEMAVLCIENTFTEPHKNTKLFEQNKVASATSVGSVSWQAPSGSTQQMLVDKSTLEYGISASGNNAIYGGHLSGMSVATNIPSQSKEVNSEVGGKGLADGCLYMGSSFKSQSYVNHYTHGDFAASAAANLAILSSEENRISESRSSNSYKKFMSENFSLQIKAFSSAAIRFFWPNSEKKIVEVPRERCGWCLSCQSSVSSKRGCLLNAAASNAIKGAMKLLSGFRPVKSVEGSFPDISTYVMFLEECLCGLTVGPFQSSTYRTQWRKQIQQATTCSAIKTVLLELEQNINIIALSGDWIKLADNWSVETSVAQSATSAGSIQRRGPGRRSKKQSTMPEVTTDDSQDMSTGFTWWHGGMLSKLLLQKGTLPRSMVRKAARGGGSRKIPGILYADGFEVPRRSRQFIWRAAVETSKNASQLALQVRYLDFHVRWNDLVRPENNLLDGKGPETEASAFRNAFICDKKIVDKKIRYGVAFGNQKHLPSRVMKNILEVEKSEDGKEKFWFLEMRIPLYLIKEFEEKADKVLSPSPDKPVEVLSSLQRSQLKASRKDIFSYLLRKSDNLEQCCCASCQLDVILGNAVTCSTCQGYCHEQCTVSSTVNVNEEVEFLITCKQCCGSEALPANEINNESPTSPLLLQAQELPNAVIVTKTGKQSGCKRSLPPVGTAEHLSDVKPFTPDSRLQTKIKRKALGLIWKRKNIEDNGIDFRIKNLRLKDTPVKHLPGLTCHLCNKPYNPELMYICCETCKNWYHAEAVELDESRILELVGFKCCKCRRIKSPVCPYDTNSDSKKEVFKKPRTMGPKKGNSGVGPDSESIKRLNEELPALPTEEVVYLGDENLFSLPPVHQATQDNPEVNLEWNAVTDLLPVPQKLPVRRHVKHETDLGSSADNPSPSEFPTPVLVSVSNPPEDELIQWDVSTSGFDDDMMFDYGGLDYEDMEFEPQTYFSFKELLSSDDGGQLDELDCSGDAVGNWENPSAIPGDSNPESYDMGVTYEPDFAEPGFGILPCRACSQTEPCPDLSCEVCGLWMHQSCSPWVEEPAQEGNWRCGNCREWQ